MILVVQKGCQPKKAHHTVWDIAYVTCIPSFCSELVALDKCPFSCSSSRQGKYFYAKFSYDATSVTILLQTDK